jgi:hypothetical protein
MPDVIVISVKEIELNRDAEDLSIAVERWRRRAVDESIKQVYGAVRRLSQVTTVTKMDGSPGNDLGPPESRRIHRVAVAIGGEDLVPLQSGDHGQGFVHVFSAKTFELVLSELDTITDLVDYLSAREQLLTGGLKGNVIASEHDLLAVYFMNTHSFRPLLENDYDMMVLHNVWDDFVKQPGYAARQDANAISLVWDNIIKTLHDDHFDDNMEPGTGLFSVDRVTRVMARESRTERRGLSEAFMAFFESPKMRARMIMTERSTYVFLKTPHGEDREYRKAELAARVWIAKDQAHQQGRDGPVVGIATEAYEAGKGFSFDAMLLDAEWTEDHAREAERLRSELDFFSKPLVTHRGIDEFPTVGK